MKGRYLLAAALTCQLASAAVIVSSQGSSPPALSEVDRLKLQTVAQRIELAQLRAQIAQREFDQAREDLSKLMVTLKVDGYTLDLASLTYTKDPPAASPPK